MARARKSTETFPLPESYLEGREEIPEGFQEAFDHAKRHGNKDKASLLYADAHHQEFASGAKEKE